VTAPLASPPAPGVHAAPLKVFVRGLRLQAEVGVYDHEHGRLQPLLVEVELQIAGAGFDHIADTVNYETVRDRAKALAAAGHWKLIETFAERLAYALIDDPRVQAVRVRVEKPEALHPDAAAAGVEISLERA